MTTQTDKLNAEHGRTLIGLAAGRCGHTIEDETGAVLMCISEQADYRIAVPDTFNGGPATYYQYRCAAHVPAARAAFPTATLETRDGRKIDKVTR